MLKIAAPEAGISSLVVPELCTCRTRNRQPKINLLVVAVLLRNCPKLDWPRCRTDQLHRPTPGGGEEVARDEEGR